MKNWIVTTIVLLSFTVGFAQETEPQEAKKWTLEACIMYALENNISVQQSIIDVKAVDIEQRAAVGSFLPTVNAGLNNTWNLGLNEDKRTGANVNQTSHFISPSLSSNVVLYDGLKNKRRLQRVKLTKIANELQLEKIQQDIAVAVANSFLDVILNKENIKIQKEQLANNELRLTRTEELVKGGQQPKGEVLNVKADISSNKQALINAENNLYLSKIALAQLLAIENPAEFTVDDSEIIVEPSNILVQTPEAIVNKALSERIEVKLAQSNVNVLRKDIAIAKGGKMPTLSGFYGFSSTYSSNDKFTDSGLQPADPFINQLWNTRGHSFGVNLSVPIFNGFSVKNDIERAQVNLEKAKLSERQAKQDLAQEIYRAYAATQSALEMYVASQETVLARAEAFRYTEERYKLGVSNSFDLSQSQVALTNAQSQSIQAKYDYLFKVKILELYFGVKLF